MYNKSTFKYGLITLVIVSFSIRVFSESFVWQVEKDGNRAFIGGTVHLLRKGDLPLPDIYDRVYQDSEILVTEIDMNEMAGAAARMMQMGMYQDDTTLESVLSPEVVEKFKAFCRDNKLPYDAFQKLKPMMVSVQVSLGALMKAGADQPGIDTIYMQKAVRDGKKRAALETVDRQLNALFASNAKPDNIITSLINDYDDPAGYFDMMVKGIFNGDVSGFDEKLLQPMEASAPGMYDSLVVKRNNEWIPLIEAMLDTPEVELILVGTLHLVGDVGVIKQLESNGYKVTPLK